MFIVVIAAHQFHWLRFDVLRSTSQRWRCKATKFFTRRYAISICAWIWTVATTSDITRGAITFVRNNRLNIEDYWYIYDGHYLRFSSFGGGELLLLCFIVEKSVGVNCGEVLRGWTMSGLLLLLGGKPLSGPRILFSVLVGSSADDVELLWSRLIIPMPRLKNGICVGGNGGGGDAALRWYKDDSSCIGVCSGFSGVRTPELARFCIWANCYKLHIKNNYSVISTYIRVFSYTMGFFGLLLC